MIFSERNRPRLLVISKDPMVRNDLVILLSGCGYFVDYVENRLEGIKKFRNFKHAVVIMDVHALPKYPKRMLKLFRVYKKNPIILIVAHYDEAQRIYPYMRLGIFDIVPLPFQVDRLYFVLKRLVEHSRLAAQNEFSKMFLYMLLITLPVWLIAIWFVARHLPFWP
jgi:DNA-binding NtrC family response regulator